MHRSVRLLVLAPCLLAACDSAPANAPADLGGSPVDQAAPPADLTSVGTPDLADDGKGTTVSDPLAAQVIGSYAMQMKSTSIQDLPFIGKMPSTSVSLALVEVKRDGQGLAATEQGCRVTVQGGSLAMTTIPDAVPRNVPATATPFRVWEEGGVTRWRRPETVIAIGVKLASPNDPLPTMANDARVWDQDKDGQPGVTVKVSGFATGDIYVVQKQRSSYSGTVAAPFQIAGTVSDASEQSVIGSSNPTLNQNIKSMPDPDPGKNTIAFVKLTTPYDCDKLVADASKLFP